MAKRNMIDPAIMAIEDPYERLAAIRRLHVDPNRCNFKGGPDAFLEKLQKEHDAKVIPGFSVYAASPEGYVWRWCPSKHGKWPGHVYRLMPKAENPRTGKPLKHAYYSLRPDSGGPSRTLTTRTIVELTFGYTPEPEELYPHNESDEA